jgi:hypothetical protein
MSLAFAYNGKDYVYIAADGRRVQLDFNKEGYLEPTGVITSEDYRKARPLTKKSVIFLGGICEITEKIYDEIRSQVDDNSKFDEIIKVIQEVSRKYHQLSGLPSDADKTSSTATVLACYEGKPLIAGLSPANNYEPIIFDQEGNYGFKGNLVGEREGNAFVVNVPPNRGERLCDYIFKIYQHIAKQSFSIGGMLRVYRIDSKGINLEEKRMIIND